MSPLPPEIPPDSGGSTSRCPEGFPEANRTEVLVEVGEETKGVWYRQGLSVGVLRRESRQGRVGSGSKPSIRYGRHMVLQVLSRVGGFRRGGERRSLRGTGVTGMDGL